MSTSYWTNRWTDELVFLFKWEHSLVYIVFSKKVYLSVTKRPNEASVLWEPEKSKCKKSKGIKLITLDYIRESNKFLWLK